MPAALFVIVGPSGVGKDTLLDGARQALSGEARIRFARRVITRPADAGGEDHHAVTEAEFEALLARGAFIHHWHAHGLRYGIARDVADDLAAGIGVVLNTSRNEIAAFRQLADRVVVIHVTASPEAVEKRLRARGRESEADIARRLNRIAGHGLANAGALELRNDGTVQEGIAALVRLIAGSSGLHAGIWRFPDDPGAR